MAKIGGGKDGDSPAYRMTREPVGKSPEWAARVLHERRLMGISDEHDDPAGDARIERRLRMRDDERRSRK